MRKRLSRAWLPAAFLATVVTLLATESTWVFPSETTLDSAAAVEAVSQGTAHNLCEGINGIPTGGDPGWVRVNGSPDPSTPFVEARGQVLPDFTHRTNPFITHTDAPFNHYSHDLNVFLTLDAGYRHLLASGNFEAEEENQHGQLEIEWERSGIPMFAWPSPHDRLTVWGVWVWDCGHGLPGIGFSPVDDPSDPIFGLPGIELIPPFYSTEIHPPVGWVVYRNTANFADRDGAPRPEKRTQDPWVWYESDDWQGTGASWGGPNVDVASTGGLVHTPVQATVADAFFSSFGGNIPEALNGCDDTTGISGDTEDAPCLYAVSAASFEWAQPLLQQDYTFFVPAPPKPDATATMIWESENRCGDVPSSPGNPPGDNVEDVSEADDGAENIGAATCNTIPAVVQVTTENGQPGIRVTVKAHTGGVSYPGNAYIAFAKRYKVAWDFVPPEAQRVNTYEVDFQTLNVVDDTDDVSDGEWVMSLRVNESWIHPVRGSGDDGEPFYDNGTLGSDTSYSIGESLSASPAAGQPLRIWVRGWDDDTTFIQDNDVNEVLPLINEYFYDLSSIAPGSSRSFNRSGSGGIGDYNIDYTIRNLTLPSPSLGTLSVGTPSYGPNDDTGNTTRVSALTPIDLTGSNGQYVEFRFFKLNDPFISPWGYGTSSDPWSVTVAGIADGRYALQYAPVSADGIVGERRSLDIELDTTPPALTVPADMKLPATSAAGRTVDWQVTAADNLPGPVTADCEPASGSFFLIKHVTTVSCTAADAVGNTTTKTFTIEVYSPFGYIPDFVALGHEWVSVGSGVTVQSGNVGAFAASGGAPTAAGFEVLIGPSSLLVGGPQIAAESVQLQSMATAGEDYYVDRALLGSGATHVPKPGYVPLFLAMPDFPSISGSGPDQHVQGSMTLPPGTYGKLSLAPNAIVTLASAGGYQFSAIDIGPNAVLKFAGPGTVTIRVAGRVSLAYGAKIGGDVPAPQLVIYVAGSDGPPATPSAFDSGTGATVRASVYARNGTLRLGTSVIATGTFLGRTVVIGSSTTLKLEGGAFDIIYP